MYHPEQEKVRHSLIYSTLVAAASILNQIALYHVFYFAKSPFALHDLRYTFQTIHEFCHSDRKYGDKLKIKIMPHWISLRLQLQQ